MQDRVDDYLKFGVGYVWILDPSRRKAWRCTADGMREVAELRTEEPETIVAGGCAVRVTQGCMMSLAWHRNRLAGRVAGLIF